MRRGRPKYDDVLTPREWEVLDLVRQGKTNEQIALELGISVNGAKFHVSEIISKLGVSSRREAAAQRVEPRLQRTGVRSLIPLGLLRFAGVAVLGIAAVGFVALAAGVLISSNGDGSSAVQPPEDTPVPEDSTPPPTLTEEEQEEASLAATQTVEAGPTRPPEPVLAPSGEPVPVWVYEGTDPAEDCLDLLEGMIPASAPDDIEGEAVECTLPEEHRLRLVLQDDDTFHLESVMTRVLLREALPSRTEPGLHDCEDVRDLILVASEPPKAETFVGDCAYVPAYRDEPDRAGSLIWTNVETALAPSDLAPDELCEVMSLYLGPSRAPGEGVVDDTCLLR